MSVAGTARASVRWAISGLVLLPVVWLMGAWAHIDAELWQHLVTVQLPRLLGSTLGLTAGVVGIALVLALPLAWFNARYDYPGRRFFEIAQILPLAIPAYVFAFVYAGLLAYPAPVRRTLRDWLGGDPRWLDVSNAPVAALVLALAFYPYIYLLARQSFARLGRIYWEQSRVIGLSAAQRWWRVVLPLSWPAISLGALLVAMETLADFGAVAALGRDTFTTAIYRAWLGMHSLDTAAQLATVLLALVAMLVWLTALSTHRGEGESSAPWPRRRLAWQGAGLVLLAQALVFVAAFVLPVAQVASWAMAQEAWSSLLAPLQGSATLGGLSAALVSLVALAYVLAQRGPRPPLLQPALFGYAIPGTVLAVALVLAFASMGWTGRGLLLLLAAYAIRFLRVAASPVLAARQEQGDAAVLSAAGLGAGPVRRLLTVRLPMLAPALGVAALMVGIEVIKELPATLMLRPYGLEALSVKVYQWTAEGEWERAAQPALVLVGLGMLPALWLGFRRSQR